MPSSVQHREIDPALQIRLDDAEYGSLMELALLATALIVAQVKRIADALEERPQAEPSASYLEYKLQMERMRRKDAANGNR